MKEDEISPEQAIEWLYQLLRVCQRWQPKDPAILYRSLRKERALGAVYHAFPNLDVWVRLCQEALLLERELVIYPAILAEEWIIWPLGKKLHHLVRAWQRMPRNRKNRQFRRKVLEKMIETVPLTKTDLKETRLLAALGLIAATGLSQAGQAVLTGNEGDWIDNPGPTPPEDILEAERCQSVVRIREGICLEFENSSDLLKLRSARRVRRAAQSLLSPRHVLVEPVDLPLVAGRLARLGMISEKERREWEDHVENTDSGTDSLSLTKNDRAILLGLGTIARNYPGPYEIPGGVTRQLSMGFDEREKRAIQSKAQAWIETQIPKTSREQRAEDEGTVGSDTRVIGIINNAITRQESVKIKYPMKDGGMEERQISPILIEERYGRMYLVGFCHKRKANRTFRLDRILVDE